MPRATLGDLTMYYEEHGDRDGAPLVLLHGWFGVADVWRPQVDAFGARYRLIVPDLRGHGRTDNPAPTTTAPNCAPGGASRRPRPS